jgi:hypothetical protein
VPTDRRTRRCSRHRDRGIGSRDWLAGSDRGIGSRDYRAPASSRGSGAFLPDVAEAKGLVDQAWWQPYDRLTPVYSHRDVKPDNVLLASASASASASPVLVDWDGAGLDFAEWEVPRAALAFSRCRGGWHRPSFDRVVRTYQAVTGRRVPPVAASFAGVLRLQLGAAAFLLWRALGYRPVTAPERAAARGHALEVLTELRAGIQQLGRWTHWLDTS